MSEVVDEVVEETEVVPPGKAPTFAAKDDPRAMGAIRRAKGFGGLGGFVLTGVAAHLHGELVTSVLVRALAGGLAGYMVAWLAAVTIWRRIIRAEFQNTVEQMAARARAARSEAQAQ